jgi:hypothetical protein
MKIENVEVYGFRAALRGMRNAKDSWDRADSLFYLEAHDCDPETDTARKVSGSELCTGRMEGATWGCGIDGHDEGLIATETPIIGPNDMALCKSLIAAGSDHRKFLRFIGIWCDLVLPRYVWTEADTYKVGTVRNSCSTMNTLGKRDLVQEDFENGLPDDMLAILNAHVVAFQDAERGDKRHARVILKDLLPEGFLQKATVFLNYEVALRMYFGRRKHRLPQWREGVEGSLCEWIKSLPYMGDFIWAASKKEG